MKTYLICLVLSICCSDLLAQDNSCAIKAEGSHILFIHALNKFNVNESMFGNQEIVLESDNGEITKISKGKYSIKPSLMGRSNISIYNADKSQKLYNEQFNIAFSDNPEIIPVFTTQDFKITENEIPKEKILELRGFSTASHGQEDIIFLIDEIVISIHSQLNGVQEFVTGNILTNEVKEVINSLMTGDLIILKSIKIKSVSDYSKKDSPDQIFNLSPTAYFVK